MTSDLKAVLMRMLRVAPSLVQLLVLGVLAASCSSSVAKQSPSPAPREAPTTDGPAEKPKASSIVPRSAEEARERIASYQKSCDSGQGALYCCVLGLGYFIGSPPLGIPRDEARAEAVLRGCHSPPGAAEYNVGVMTHNICRDGDYESTDTNQTEMEEVVSDPCSLAGAVARKGIGGVRQDDAAAASYYKMSCSRGHRRGCFALAMMTRAGAGVPRDEAQARRLFEQSCTAGFVEACNQLAAR